MKMATVENRENSVGRPIYRQGLALPAISV
jgi:hypothetical protein